ncbi:phosphoethanolamine transferase [Pectinatus haikarae]|uniref:Heptose-I-phosphate ethanolaminephosphotransferase n=1 Tax=Pectinatus haikarae TaxID=349096 RepID=A0ABT9Y4Y6_9FIRM|nr:phosphoethanolamine transferase [Pectinatus haikarae]MDQ0202895.1 heptose-I-phosphate ethanolaminephosphotransferase [Pectinatus haikarae]
MNSVNEKIFTIILKKLSGYEGFIIGIFIFNYLSVGWSLWQTNNFLVMLLEALFLFAAILAFTLLLAAVPCRCIRKILGSLIFYISGALCLAELFSIYTYNAVVGPGIITALLETNSNEASEFFKMYINWSWLLYWLFFFTAAYLLKKKAFFQSGFFAKHRRGSFVPVFLLISGITAGFSLLLCYKPLILSNLLDIPAVRVYAAAQTAISNIRTYQNLDQEMSATDDIIGNNSTIPNIVFILGEATNRNHMHLYGYSLPDTPNLDELRAKNELAVFTDCISPHATTVGVLRELFTFCNYEADKPWYEYNNLIDVMNAAGYKTNWLSNQESSGIWGNVALLYAKRSAFHEFTSMRESHEDYGTLDEDLFPLLDTAMKNSAGKNFYVLHLMGGHSLYYKRFPYAFSKFGREDIVRDADDDKKTVLAQYANALYYNDYIVSGIIDKFRSLNAIVIYLPDHGETVYDDNSGFSGHVEENPNHYMLEVPMIMWASDEFKRTYPQKWASVTAAIDRPYMTDDMIHTILDIADIKTTEYEPERSIINVEFDASRQRMVQGRNYDTQIRSEAAR